MRSVPIIRDSIATRIGDKDHPYRLEIQISFINTHVNFDNFRIISASNSYSGA